MPPPPPSKHTRPPPLLSPPTPSASPCPAPVLLPPIVTTDCLQLGRVRVRQHVTPLASKFQQPTPTVDWAAVYKDPTRPLFVVGGGVQ